MPFQRARDIGSSARGHLSTILVGAHIRRRRSWPWGRPEIVSYIFNKNMRERVCRLPVWRWWNELTGIEFSAQTRHARPLYSHVLLYSFVMHHPHRHELFCRLSCMD